ncbi:ADP-ribose pyrophosphatase [Eubacterium pyruvativorans]|jgi:ADP-ribose pyrophosphatase|uniref:ADP-ribose pyrophosphatase n=1 Tax=Eubacterium pyruvativorans TaxID=155865 RepID=A0A1I7H5K3_9FIRM|nr:NUDIX hydrolase [Eubacterium pyruvativorans]MDO5568123.1 NUDIX hydrolase [Eubacteriales bacterium]MCI5747579.1 NUDIX hydrolase [Eubacterium pyruvativorans]MDD6707397.1 NUDIX hydrolase [Eubacterium pyruvativorans]MDD7683968.1 NUDIX hydrolase [Eubacterium pyruvativorans]MDY4049366.1 NUDIX hydrolase [Eubacterium pyruvativorans]
MDEREKLAWEPVKTEHIVQDRWIDFRKTEFRMPDGSLLGPFYNYSRRSYVVIIASDEAGRFLCVRQYRQGIGRVTTEFPAGGIEPGGGSGQDVAPDFITQPDEGADEEEALEAAVRELREETGYVSDCWSHVITAPSDATISDNYAHIFRAKNCRKAGGQELDDSEYLHVELKSPEQIDGLIREGGFQQIVHMLGWMLVKGE